MILLALFLAPGLLAGSGVSPEAIPLRTLVATAAHGGAFALLILYLFDLRQERAVALPAQTRMAPIRFFVSAGAVAALMLGIGSVFSVLLAPVMPDPVAIPGVTTAVDHSLLTRIMILGGLMTIIAYSEELFFRVYLITRFQQAGTTRGVAVLAASMLFALGHGWQGWPALVFSAISGLVLGAIWIRYRRIHVIAVGHALYNVSILLISGL